MDIQCIECQERPIHIKKSQLCSRCYQRKWQPSKRHGIRGHMVAQHYGEIEFVRNYFTHKKWVHHPAIFRLGKENYAPDFYDCTRDVFIEVSATRQAYHRAKEKYELFKKTYPNLKFEIRTPEGILLNEAPSGEKWKYQQKNTN